MDLLGGLVGESVGAENGAGLEAVLVGDAADHLAGGDGVNGAALGGGDGLGRAAAMGMALGRLGGVPLGDVDLLADADAVRVAHAVDLENLRGRDVVLLGDVAERLAGGNDVDGLHLGHGRAGGGRASHDGLRVGFGLLEALALGVHLGGVHGLAALEIVRNVDELGVGAGAADITDGADVAGRSRSGGDGSGTGGGRDGRRGGLVRGFFRRLDLGLRSLGLHGLLDGLAGLDGVAFGLVGIGLPEEGAVSARLHGTASGGGEERGDGRGVEDKKCARFHGV